MYHIFPPLLKAQVAKLLVSRRSIQIVDCPHVQLYSLINSCQEGDVYELD